MILAQAIAEYALMAGVITFADSALTSIGEAVGRWDASTWLIIGTGSLMVWLLFGRLRN